MGDNSILRQAYLRELAVRYAWHWIGTPYAWGGDDFSAFDCSGFVSEILQALGVLPHGVRKTAQGLYEIFKPFVVAAGYAGCLAFWLDDQDEAAHVMLMADDRHVIGASGGGSATKTREDAIRQNAFIKIRPLSYRGGKLVIIDPFLGVA